jgi:hypothetical protein
MQVVEFRKPMVAKYLKFVARSSFEKKAYASMAELEVILATPEKR